MDEFDNQFRVGRQYHIEYQLLGGKYEIPVSAAPPLLKQQHAFIPISQIKLHYFFAKSREEVQ